MNLFSVIDSDGDQRFVETESMVIAVRLWKEHFNTEDDPASVELICSKVIRETVKTGEQITGCQGD